MDAPRLLRLTLACLCVLVTGRLAAEEPALDAAKKQRDELRAKLKELDKALSGARRDLSASPALAQQQAAVKAAQEAYEKKLTTDPKIKEADDAAAAAAKAAEAKLKEALDASPDAKAARDQIQKDSEEGQKLQAEMRQTEAKLAAVRRKVEASPDLEPQRQAVEQARKALMEAGKQLDEAAKKKVGESAEGAPLVAAREEAAKKLEAVAKTRKEAMDKLSALARDVGQKNEAVAKVRQEANAARDKQRQTATEARATEKKALDEARAALETKLAALLAEDQKGAGLLKESTETQAKLDELEKKIRDIERPPRKGAKAKAEAK